MTTIMTNLGAPKVVVVVAAVVVAAPVLTVVLMTVVLMTAAAASPTEGVPVDVHCTYCYYH